MIDDDNEKKYKGKDIIDEIHEGRATLLAKFNGDLRALFDDARQRDKESERMIVNRERPHRSDGGSRSQVS